VLVVAELRVVGLEVKAVVAVAAVATPEVGKETAIAAVAATVAPPDSI